MNKKKIIIEYGLIILLVIFIRLYIVTPIQVSGTSMHQTLYDHDIMLLNIIDYKVRGLNRFDIVVINYEKEALIKRVIGLPGENIEYYDNKLYINGKYVKETFLKENKTANFKLKELGYDKIPPNMYFVLGDNRNNSTDSRIFGLIKQKQIVGKTKLIIYPFARLGIIH